MIPESSRPAVPPIEAAAGREPHHDRPPAAPLLGILLAAVVVIGVVVWFGAPWLWELIRP